MKTKRREPRATIDGPFALSSVGVLGMIGTGLVALAMGDLGEAWLAEVKQRRVNLGRARAFARYRGGSAKR